MLNAMRSKAGGLLTKLLLGLLILSFGVWGVADMLRYGGANAPLAKIGNHEISHTSFERALHNAQDEMRARLGKNYSPELMKLLHLERKALEDLIGSDLLHMETHALGLLPPDEAVIGEIRHIPAFQNDKGEFDKNLFQQTLRHNGMAEKTLVEQVREQLATRTLVQSITAAAPVNDAMAAVLYAAQREERTADLAMLTPALIKKTPEPKVNDVEAYYTAHKNEFVTPEYRTVSYVAVKSEDLLKTINIPEAEVKAAYAEQSAAFGGKAAPFEQVRADLEKDLKNRKAAEAAAAFSVKLEDMLAGGSTFKETAKAMKLDMHTAGPFDKNGKTATGADAKLPPYNGFIESAFKADENTESSFAPDGKGTYVMIHVDSITPSAAQPLEKVKQDVAKAWQKQEVYKALGSMADGIAKEMKASKTPLSVLAAKGISTTASGAITRGSQKTSTNLVLPGGLIQDIFATKVGAATAAYPAEDRHYMIAVVLKRKADTPAVPEALQKDGEFKLFRQKLEQSAREQLLDEYLRYLRAKYHVQINNEALAAYEERAE